MKYTKDGHWEMQELEPETCSAANCSALATVALYYWVLNRYGLGNGAWSDYPLRYVCREHAEEFANEHGGILREVK